MYKGDKVGFCCGNCIKKFNSAQSKFEGKIKNAGKPFNTTCLMKSKPAKASLVVKFEKVVGFCCVNCKAKFAANPSKYAGKLQ